MPYRKWRAARRQAGYSGKAKQANLRNNPYRESGAGYLTKTKELVPSRAETNMPKNRIRRSLSFTVTTYPILYRGTMLILSLLLLYCKWVRSRRKETYVSKPYWIECFRTIKSLPSATAITRLPFDWPEPFHKTLYVLYVWDGYPGV